MSAATGGALELVVDVPERDVRVELAVAPGETVALLGPNGAGKSTVLAVAAGLLRTGASRVVLDGQELTGATFVPPHRRRVALLAQEPLLFPHLDVLENVAFGPRSAGAGRAAARDRARHWLAELRVAELAGRRPAAISGGQAQRVAVARALAAEPGLLLLDEPMAALDVAVTPALRQTLARVLADRSVLVVTHDVLDALLLADRVVVLEGGRVTEQGRAADVLARPRSGFAASFAGLNLVAGTWRDGAVVGPGARLHGTVGDDAPAEGGEAVAVFRPSAVAVHDEPPGGSPRNALPVTVTEVEPLGDRVRVRAGELSADVTPHSAAALDLVPGSRVVFTVKATEVAVHAR
ncbi:ATP-binding cassette domain-containing protein [Nocardioides sp. SYSU D00038]|uniref:sulfate/molybdate ABC transporter ATP-binding protein n=1 Tax=Nocardioides sp. SYSU D00038 TaxID=2812554 RepID=UPI0027DB4C92|nr:ATP-binding cassette domain-containing protein [Nocardioides sp. SYSU D00038]